MVGWSDETEWVEVDCKVQRVTDAALLLARTDHPGVAKWVPKSAIDGGEDFEVGDEDIVSIKAWKATDLGWT
jgi:hypothetical protein